MKNGESKVPLLEFQGVSLGSASALVLAVEDVSFAVGRGDFVLIWGPAEDREMPLCDLAGGLVDPVAGKVRFMGEDWCALSDARSDRMRGRIGRTFEHGGWISSLTSIENTLLAAQHHGKLVGDELLQAAESIARDIGLPGLSHQRPDLMPPRELQRRQWIRAFLCRPDLVLLDFPETSVLPRDMAALFTLVRRSRETGTAVVWLTRTVSVWRKGRQSASALYRFEGSGLIDADGYDPSEKGSES